MKNLILKLRFFYLNLTGYFAKQHEVKKLDNQILYDDFYWSVDWKVWHPNEHWGNVKDDGNPYIIWLPEEWDIPSLRVKYPLRTGKRSMNLSRIFNDYKLI